MTQEERSDLAEFVGQMRTLMQHFAHIADVVVADTPEKAQRIEEFREALAELDDGDFFHQAQEELADPVHEEPGERGMTRLQRLGLAGRNLRLKLGNWRSWYEHAMGSVERRPLRLAFGAGVTVLGSAVSMSGAAEPIKELAEVASSLLEE